MTLNAKKAYLKERLGAQPRYPISLLPTPLMELPRFSSELGGPRIWMKRDDMTGLAYGGNKARKLDYFIGEAKAQGCDVFIGGGGAVQSNHALMCAAAARKAGMLPIIFAREGTAHYRLQGDFLLTKLLLDGGVFLYPTADPVKEKNRYLPQLSDLMKAAAESLEAQGYHPYILPGSGQPAGTLGYVECALELAEQWQAMDLEPDWIFLTSSGGGQAGLLLGAKVLEQGHQIVGCAPGPYGSDGARAANVADLANRTAELLDVDARIDPREVVNYDYSGGAYGVPSQAGMDALGLLARTEGLFLDPVYTSKAMAGLIDQIRQGTVAARDTVVFVHTGGLPLNFAYSEELAQAHGLTLDTDRQASQDGAVWLGSL